MARIAMHLVWHDKRGGKKDMRRVVMMVGYTDFIIISSWISKEGYKRTSMCFLGMVR